MGVSWLRVTFRTKTAVGFFTGGNGVELAAKVRLNAVVIPGVSKCRSALLEQDIDLLCD